MKCTNYKAVVVMVAMLLSACGQKGDLYLKDEPHPMPTQTQNNQPQTDSPTDDGSY